MSVELLRRLPSVGVTATSLAATLSVVVQSVIVPVVGTPVVPTVAVMAMPPGVSVPVAVVMSVLVASMVPTPVVPVMLTAVAVPVPRVTVVGVGQRYAGRRYPGVVAIVGGRAEGNRETDNCDRHADQLCRTGFDHLCLRVPIRQDQRYARAIERGLN